jgi:hypothetical protein
VYLYNNWRSQQLPSPYAVVRLMNMRVDGFPSTSHIFPSSAQEGHCKRLRRKLSRRSRTSLGISSSRSRWPRVIVAR